MTSYSFSPFCGAAEGRIAYQKRGIRFGDAWRTIMKTLVPRNHSRYLQHRRVIRLDSRGILVMIAAEKASGIPVCVYLTLSAIERLNYYFLLTSSQTNRDKFNNRDKR
ncbi:hypothetical protein CDAR_97081 [Caerostris darwini]|uniref:Uncharacterized protein n=1 Tax=Caerostris darwini TaxID=1538125 RepID=A0AAV4QKV3_9ARAC|nr:hypothetical protein CDAR_97081 [Caerostris darwini]